MYVYIYIPCQFPTDQNPISQCPIAFSPWISHPVVVASRPRSRRQATETRGREGRSYVAGAGLSQAKGGEQGADPTEQGPFPKFERKRYIAVGYMI